MKKLFTLILLFLYISINAQDQYYQKPVERNNPLLVDGELYLDSFYQSVTEKIFFSGVLYFDGVKQAELLKKFKNWASLKYVNLKQVIVSETDDQIVLNYIQNNTGETPLIPTYPIVGMYIRLLAQFKDGKIKCTYFDDGNTSISLNFPARSFYFKAYFKEKKGKVFARSGYIDMLLEFKENILKSFESLKKGLDKKENSDW